MIRTWLGILAALWASFAYAERSEMVVGIIGAGIGGASAALKLADVGYRVLLIDKAAAPMARTSGMNPGRSSLGFHYTDTETGYQLIKASREFDRFFPHMHRQRDPGARYIVVRNSQISADEYLQTCELLKEQYRQEYEANPDWRHIGAPEEFYRVLDASEYGTEVDPDQVAVAIQTKETLINVPLLVETVIARLKGNPLITFMGEHEVVGADQEGNQFALFSKDQYGVEKKIVVDHVVNATWEYRHKIDSFLGVLPNVDFTNRLKLLARVTLPPDMVDFHSMMFVRGPFAMMANTGDGTAFVTYAPVTNYASTSDIAIPDHWEDMITKRKNSSELMQLGQKIIDGAARYIPKLKFAKLLEVRAGVIYSVGDADPFDPKSKMHARSEAGITEIVPGWDSLDTGKLIYGPYFASAIVESVERRYAQFTH